MAGRLDGKVALITGAARGIGKGHADIFAAEGTSVVVADVLVEPGEEVATQLRDQGYNAIFQKLDVTSQADWAAAVEAAVDRFGKLTTLVNNAGIFNNFGVDEIEVDDWNKVIAVNLTGVFLGMKAALPELEKTGNGTIVNIGSPWTRSIWRAGMRQCGAQHHSGLCRAVRSTRRSTCLPDAIPPTILPSSVRASSGTARQAC